MLKNLILILLVLISVNVRSMDDAYTLEKQALEVLLNKADPKEVERIARRVFNEAHAAEKENPYSSAVALKYQLLKEIDRFKATKVFAELLDREESLVYQKQTLNQQEKIDNNINKLQQMQQIIVQTLQEQTRKLEDTWVEQNKIQIQKLDELIDIQEKVIEQNKIQVQKLDELIDIQEKILEGIDKIEQNQN